MLAKSLVGREFGTTRILDAFAEVRPDADDLDAIFLTLTLNDPEDESGTWPIDDLTALRRAIAQPTLHTSDVPVVYVNLRPETEEPEDDELPLA